MVIGVYGPSLLDTRVLGSGPAGDTLHCPCCCLEALADLGAKRAFKDLILPHCDRGNVIDYYGPRDEDLTGKSQVREQKLHFQHHYVTEFLLGGE